MSLAEWIAIGILLFLAGVVVGLLSGINIAWVRTVAKHAGMNIGDAAAENEQVYNRLVAHFGALRLDELSVAKRQYAAGIRVDLSRALEEFLAPLAGDKLGVKGVHDYFGIEFASLASRQSDSVIAAPLQYEDIDVGEGEPARCLGDTLWLLCDGTLPLAVLTAAAKSPCEPPKLQIFIATPPTDAGRKLAQRLFEHLEHAARHASTYRGKVLSLEHQQSYTGRSTAITVHKLRSVAREQVILPPQTLELLDRNVIRFVQQRAGLAERGQAVKKGLLFYGPPGTGKTHTIHYLAGALAGHTTLIVTAEQVALLGEYLALARLYQPAIVVLEDVDLVGRSRELMDNPWAEATLNKLLNEMDGLKEDAEILFLLTTNRPEALEAALSARPGRIDQAIEFPLPDEAGRAKLVRLYSTSLALPDEMVNWIVERTSGVSAAFIKELMRRSVQFQLETDGSGSLRQADLERALEELLASGGLLNLKLLGASAPEGACGPGRNC